MLKKKEYKGKRDRDNHSTKHLWKRTTIKHSTKIRILNSTVKSVLLYRSEAWRRTERLQVNYKH